MENSIIIMVVHELYFGKTNKSEFENEAVYIIPRSADPYDYALISHFREKELLKNGLKKNIKFYGYKPILETVESKVKEFFQNRILKRFNKNFGNRRFYRLGSLFGIVACFFFVFSGFIDDFLLDPLFLFIIGQSVYREIKDRKHLNEINKHIEDIEFIENPVLTAIYENFKDIDKEDYTAPNWEKIFQSVPQKELLSLLHSLSEFLNYSNSRSWNRKLTYLETDLGNQTFYNKMKTKVKLWYYNQKKDQHAFEIRNRKRLKPGYYEIYEQLLEALEHLKMSNFHPL